MSIADIVMPRRGKPPQSGEYRTYAFKMSTDTRMMLESESRRTGRSLARTAELLIEEAVMIRRLLTALGVTLESHPPDPNKNKSKLVAIWKSDTN